MKSKPGMKTSPDREETAAVTTVESKAEPKAESKAEKKARKKAEKKARGKRGRWRRRFVRAAIFLVILAVVARIALAFILPPLIRGAAEDRGLACTWERLELSLLAGSVEIWHLAALPAEGGESFVDLEYCLADIDMSALLTGDIIARRVEVDGIDIRLSRREDGTIDFFERLASAPAGEDEPAEEEPPEEEPEEPAPIDFSLPLEVKSIRLQEARLHWKDASRSPAFETRVDLDLALSDLGAETRSARFDLTLAAAPIVDAFRVEGTATAAGSNLDAALSLRLRGFHPGAIASYLEEAGIRPVADSLSCDLAAQVIAEPSPARTDAVKLRATIEGIRASADGVEALALDRVLLEGDEIGGAFARLATLSIEDGRVRAERLPSGAVRASGFDFLPAPAVGNAAAEELAADAAQDGDAAAGTLAAGAGPDAEDSPATDAEPFVWSLGEVVVRAVGASFHDGAVAPAADLAAGLDELRVEGLASDPDGPIRFSAKLTAPGILETISLDGRAELFAPRKTLDATLAMTGVAPAALAPYLEQAGIESLLRDGSLTCTLKGEASPAPEGGTDASFSIDDLVYTDGEEFFGIDGVALSGVVVPAEGSPLRIGSAMLSGARAVVRRKADGAFEAFGFRVKSGAAMETEPLDLEFADLGLAATGLVIGPAGTTVPATVKAWFRAPGLAEEIRLDGTLVPDPAAPSVDVTLTGREITARKAAPILKEAGIELPANGMGFAARLQADCRVTPEGIDASLAVTDVTLENGEREMAGIDAIRIDDVTLQPGRTGVGTIAIENPRLRVERAATDRLIVAGISLIPPASATRTPDGGTPASAPLPPANGTAATPAAAQTPGAEAPDAAPDAASLFYLGKLRLSGAEVTWIDRAVEPGLETALRVEAVLDDFNSDPDWKGVSTFDATIRVPGSVEALTLKGKIKPSPVKPHAEIDITGSGLRAGPLAAYLAGGPEPGLEDGRFRARIIAGLAPHDEGGQSAGLEIRDVEFTDAARDETLLALGSFHAIVSRADPEEGIVAVDKVVLEGLTVNAMTTKTGGTEMLGFRFEPPPPAETDTATATDSRAATDAAVAPVAPAAESEPPPRKARTAKRETLPLVTIDTIDLKIDAFSVRSEADPSAPPAVLSDVRFRNVKPIALLGDEPETNPPVELALTAAAAGAVESLHVGVTASPFAPEPEVSILLDVKGIDSAGIARLAPGLAGLLDDATLNDGSLAGRIDASLRLRRRAAHDFDLSRGFGAELVVSDLSLRNGTEGEVLAGFDELLVDVARVDPESGDVHVKSVELVKPQGRIVQDEKGLHLLGLVIPPPPEAEGAGDGDAGEEVAIATETGETSPVATSAAPGTGATPSGSGGATPGQEAGGAGDAAAAEPGPEIRVDRLVVSGIDFIFTDTLSDPPMIVPLTDLEVDVKKFTTRAFTEAKPIRFNLYLRGGAVPLAKRPEGGNLFTGLGGAMASLAGGDKDVEMEERPLFDEIALNGQLTLAPKLTGWVKTGVSALELSGFKGPAGSGGVTLDDGLFDADVSLKFDATGALDTDSKFAFIDLSLAEEPDGPISRYLKLPAPLDVVTFLLRDENGTIDIPLDFHVAPGGISTGEIANVAVTTLGVLIADAVANSPFRVVGTATDLVPIGGLGLFGGEEEEEGEKSLAIALSPGDTHLSRGEVAKIDTLAGLLRENETTVVTLRHTLGGGDVERTALRANPSRGECLALASRLRERKARLVTLRAETADRARAAYGAGLDDAAEEARRRLQRLDDELGNTELALDRILEILRPGGERRAARRTREACTALGRTRLEAVRRELVSRVPLEAIDRIRVIAARFTEPVGEGGGQVTASWTEK